jgi:hypothetical protein
MLELPKIRKRFRKGRKPFYEVTCECEAYSYPHRFGGGYCNGWSLVNLIWNNGMCGDCSMKYYDDWRGCPECYVANGSEKLEQCEQLQEFLRRNEAYNNKLKRC